MKQDPLKEPHLRTKHRKNHASQSLTQSKEPLTVGETHPQENPHIVLFEPPPSYAEFSPYSY